MGQRLRLFLRRRFPRGCLRPRRQQWHPRRRRSSHLPRFGPPQRLQGLPRVAVEIPLLQLPLLLPSWPFRALRLLLPWRALVGAPSYSRICGLVLAGRNELSGALRLAHRRATDLYQEQQRLHQQFTRAEHRKAEEENLRQQASNARALRAKRARQADREEELASLEEEHRRRLNAIQDAARKDLQATAAMEAEAAALVQEQAEKKKKADRDERAFRGESSPPAAQPRQQRSVADRAVAAEALSFPPPPRCGHTAATDAYRISR